MPISSHCQGAEWQDHRNNGGHGHSCMNYELPSSQPPGQVVTLPRGASQQSGLTQILFSEKVCSSLLVNEFQCKRQLVVGDFGQTPTSNSFHAHFNNQTKMAPWDTRGITSRTDRLPYPDCFRSPTSPNSALRPYTAGGFQYPAGGPVCFLHQRSPSSPHLGGLLWSISLPDNSGDTLLTKRDILSLPNPALPESDSLASLASLGDLPQTIITLSPPEGST